MKLVVEVLPGKDARGPEIRVETDDPHGILEAMVTGVRHDRGSGYISVRAVRVEFRPACSGQVFTS